MEYTEEVKKEADSVVKKYKYLYDVIHTEVDAIRCAIQDRQSVLDKIYQLIEKKLFIVSKEVMNEIQSLTQQINYLKSKI